MSSNLKWNVVITPENSSVGYSIECSGNTFDEFTESLKERLETVREMIEANNPFEYFVNEEMIDPPCEVVLKAGDIVEKCIKDEGEF